VADEYKELLKSKIAERRSMGKVTPGTDARLKQLKITLGRYFGHRQRNMHTSIVSASHIDGKGVGSGGHVSVTEHGMHRWLVKYSHDKLKATPQHVEFLQKKVQLLELFLGQYIPRTRVIYGERRRKGFNQKDPNIPTPVVKSAITIQEYIHGKTFKEMTPEERALPEVQDALKHALLGYAEMRLAVERACILCGKHPNALNMSLDVNYATTPEKQVNTDNLSSFDSPNAMYDFRTGKIHFIDIGFGVWNADTEEVYQYILAHQDDFAQIKKA
jgi:hypothetical protein